MEALFRESGVDMFIHPECISYVSQKQLKLIPRQECLLIQQSLAITRLEYNDTFLLTPSTNSNSVIFPFSTGKIDEEIIGGRSLREILTVLSVKSQLFIQSSANKDIIFSIYLQNNTIDFKLINLLAIGNATNPMFISNQEKNVVFGYDIDLEYAFISSLSDSIRLEEIVGNFSDWDHYLVKNYMDGLPTNYNYQEVMNCIVQHSLPGRIPIIDRF